MMKERWVKKEEVENQLDEIFQLLLEIDDKMEKVIRNIVVHHCETKEAYINDLEKRVEKMESDLDVRSSARVDVFQKTLSLSAFSS
jgi:chaperonin cofactor prefoldin